MNYVSFDLETTGLDPHTNDVLEAAFVVDGEEYYDTPLQLLPWNSILVAKEDYNCSPFVAMMHTKNGLWKDIETARKRVNDGVTFDLEKGHKPSRETVIDAMGVLFAQIGAIVGNKVVLAGKNVASFDLKFLVASGVVDHQGSFDTKYSGSWDQGSGTLEPWDSLGLGTNPCKGMKIAHRCLDVGPMYYQRGLDHIPDTKLCCELAGIPTPNDRHRAYGDCIQVAALIRKKILGTLRSDDLEYLKFLAQEKPIC